MRTGKPNQAGQTGQTRANTTEHEGEHMTQWEYRQEYVQLKRKALDAEALQGLTEFFNKCGADGWELVSVLPDVRDAGMLAGTRPHGVVTVFKRPVSA